MVSGEFTMTWSENWRPGDIVMDANQRLWCRSDDERWPWARGPGHVPGGAKKLPVLSGGAEEDHPRRPLLLLARDGLPYWALTDAAGVPVPAWAIRSSLDALESQLGQITTEHNELRAGLIALAGELRGDLEGLVGGERAYDYATGRLDVLLGNREGGQER